MSKWEKNAQQAQARTRAGGSTVKGNDQKGHGGPFQSAAAERLADTLETDTVSPDDLTTNAENPFDPLADDVFASLVSDVKKNGVLAPVLARITSDRDGRRKGEIIDGHNRHRAAKAAGLAKIPVLFAPASMSVQDAKRIAFTLQHNRRNESQSGLIKSLAQIYPEYFKADARGKEKGHGGLIQRIVEETHISERTLKRYKETLHRAGGERADKEAIQKAKEKQNQARREKERSSEAANASGWPSVSAALVAIRRALPTLTKADKKAARKELERLIQDCDL